LGGLFLISFTFPSPIIIKYSEIYASLPFLLVLNNVDLKVGLSTIIFTANIFFVFSPEESTIP
jgi:hypothetical protein